MVSILSILILYGCRGNGIAGESLPQDSTSQKPSQQNDIATSENSDQASQAELSYSFENVKKGMKLYLKKCQKCHEKCGDAPAKHTKKEWRILL